MKTKRIIASALAVCMALTVVSCGNSESGSAKVKDPDNITEEDFEKAAEKLDSMSEEDFEKALEGKGGIDLGGDTDTGKAAEEEPAEAKPEYEPCDEIKNADFTSGLIQIGNDVFKCGGYITLREFVEKYGENWDCSGIDLNAPIPTEFKSEELDNFFEIPNKEKSERTIFVSYLTAYDDISEIKKAESEQLNIDWIAKTANNFAPFAYFKSISGSYDKSDSSKWLTWRFYKYSDNATLGDSIVYNIEPNQKANNITFYPQTTTRFIEGIKDNEDAKKFAADFYMMKSDAIELLDADTIEDLIGETTTERTWYRYKRSTSNIKNTSYLYTNSLLEKKATQWYGNDMRGVYGIDAIFTYNIRLTDKNLLGFEPIINLRLAYNSEQALIRVDYFEYQLTDNVISFTTTNNPWVKKI